MTYNFRASLKSYFVIVAIAVIAIVSGTARAQTVYDNGTYDGISGFNFTELAVADDFKVSSPLTFNSIRFYAHDLPPGLAGSFSGGLSWYISANNAQGKPGTVLLSGFSSAVSVTDTGAKMGGNPDFEIGQFDFSVGQQILTGGDYWLRITEGAPGSGPQDSTPLYWMTTTSRQGSTAVSGGLSPSPDYSQTGVDLAFQLRNEVGASVNPEPGSIALMALGLSTGVCIAHRKRRVSR